MEVSAPQPHQHSPVGSSRLLDDMPGSLLSGLCVLELHSRICPLPQRVNPPVATHGYGATWKSDDYLRHRPSVNTHFSKLARLARPNSLRASANASRRQRT